MLKMPLLPPLETGVDRIRGQVDVPLSPHGQEQVAALGQRLGGFDTVHVGPTQRTTETGKALGGSRLVQHPELSDMHYGVFHGFKTKDVIKQINEYIRDGNTPMPAGESFNTYKDRFLKAMVPILADHYRDPQQRTAVVLNRRSLKTFEGWLANGAKHDFSVDTKVVTHADPANEPGNVYKVIEDHLGNPGLQHITEDDDHTGPGLFLVRHGTTIWNKEDGKS